MKPTTKLLGLTAACAACCAAPAFLMPVLAGIGLAGAGSAIVGWSAGLVVLAMAVLGFVVLRHRHAAGSVPVGQDCGCTPVTSNSIGSSTIGTTKSAVAGFKAAPAQGGCCSGQAAGGQA